MYKGLANFHQTTRCYSPLAYPNGGSHCLASKCS